MTTTQSSATTTTVAGGTPATWDGRHWRRAVYRADGLTPAQTVVLLYLEDECAHWKTGTGIRPAAGTVAGALGLNRSTVLGHLQALRSAGWLIQTAPATPRKPAEYRLSYGRHATVPCNSDPNEGSEKPTPHPTRGRKSQPLRSEKPTSEVGNPDPNSVLNSVLNSSSSANRPETAAPTAPSTTEEEEDDRDFNSLMKAWPNPRAKSRTARDNARAAWDEIVNRPGFNRAAVLVHARRDITEGRVTTDTWPDAWLRDTWPTATTPKSSGPSFDAKCPDCPDCLGSGRREDEHGRDIGRCDHSNAPSRRRASSDPWDRVPLVTRRRNDYDAYRDAPRPPRPIFHDDDDVVRVAS